MSFSEKPLIETFNDNCLKTVVLFTPLLSVSKVNIFYNKIRTKLLRLLLSFDKTVHKLNYLPLEGNPWCDHIYLVMITLIINLIILIINFFLN